MACIITHCCLLSLVQYGKCPASLHSVWKPVMSGTVTVRDMWLFSDIPLFLSFQEPLWCSSPVSRDVLMCSSRDVLCSVNLCPTFSVPSEHDELPGEQRCGNQSKYLVSLSLHRIRQWQTNDQVKHRRLSRRTRCGQECLVSPWWRDRTCHNLARGIFMSVFALVIRNTKARLDSFRESLSFLYDFFLSCPHAPLYSFPFKMAALSAPYPFFSSLYLVLSRFSLPAGVCQ